MQEGAQKPRPKFKFEKGDEVRVIDGPFANFNGTIDEVIPEKGKVRVLVSIFGRSTPVELDFVQVNRTLKAACVKEFFREWQKKS